MNAVTRWKTIATIAVAFSAGNLFATACQDANKANAQDGTTGGGDGTTGGGDGSTPPPEVSAADLAELAEALVATEAEVASLKCFIGHMVDDEYWDAQLYSDGSDESGWKTLETDHNNDGERTWHQGPNSDSMRAYEDCF